MKLRIIMVLLVPLWLSSSVYAWQYQVQNRTEHELEYLLDVSSTTFTGTLKPQEIGEIHKAEGLCFTFLKARKKGQSECLLSCNLHKEQKLQLA